VIIGVAWGIAGAIAVVVALFCAYEIRWKLARLRADLASLNEVTDALRVLVRTDRAE
jgi:hypothetical protein